MSMRSSDRSDWSISIPLSELVALQGLPAKMELMEIENKQLRKEIEALRCLYSQALEVLGDIKRELRQPRGKAS